MSTLNFAKNAISNIASGASGAVLAIVLPHFFVRNFSATEFSVWVLILQIGSYVNYFNFGIQTAIGRYVAFYLERKDEYKAKEIFGAGLQILSILFFLAMAVIFCLSVIFPEIFTEVPDGFVDLAQEMLLWVGGTLALGLPFTSYLGLFVGLQRNEIPAAISVVGKLMLALCLIYVAQFHDLRAVARAYFFINLLIYVVQFGFFRAIRPNWRGAWRHVSGAARRELIGYCAALTVWSLGMLLINGLSTALVGMFDFVAVGAFGTAATAVSFLMGLVGALFAPTLQIFARLNANGEWKRELALLEGTSFLCLTGLLVGSCAFLMVSRPFFDAWVGPEMAETALPFFIVLLAAGIIRNIMMPFSLYVMASNQQQKIIVSAVVEGGANFLSSVIAVQFLGAYGVALGAIIGAVAGIVMHVLYSFPRTLPAGFQWPVFLVNVVLKPLLLTLPMCLVAGVSLEGGGRLIWLYASFLPAAAPTLIVLYKRRNSVHLIGA